MHREHRHLLRKENALKQIYKQQKNENNRKMKIIYIYNENIKRKYMILPERHLSVLFRNIFTFVLEMGTLRYSEL